MTDRDKRKGDWGQQGGTATQKPDTGTIEMTYRKGEPHPWLGYEVQMFPEGRDPTGGGPHGSPQMLSIDEVWQAMQDTRRSNFEFEEHFYIQPGRPITDTQMVIDKLKAMYERNEVDEITLSTTLTDT